MTVFFRVHKALNDSKVALWMFAAVALDTSAMPVLYCTMPLGSRLHVNIAGMDSSLGIKPASRASTNFFNTLVTPSCRAPLGIAISSSNLSRENGPGKLSLFSPGSLLVGPPDLIFFAAQVFLCEDQSFFWQSFPQYRTCLHGQNNTHPSAPQFAQRFVG